jgi:DNA-binding SARP family transcriptional activator
VLLHLPWQEQAMKAALQLGDRTTAIKAYRRMVKVLERELGIPPQEELQRVFNEIRNHQ